MFRVFIALLLVAVATSSTEPGVTLSISQHGLQYAAGVAIDQLSAKVKGQSIPDQHGTAHTHVGHVKYDITGMRITSFTKPSSSIAVHSGAGVTWSLSNAGVSLHGDWRYKYLFIRDHGNFDVSVSGASITVSITMGTSADGHPTIKSTSCSCSIGHVHVSIHGGASWFYNLFKGTIQRALSKNIRDLLCKEAKNGIDVDAEKALQKMKVKVPVHKSPVIIDYRLVSPPLFGSGYIQTSHKGEFFFGSDQSEAPFLPGPIRQPQSTQKMVTICIADYVMNTLGYVLNKYRLLRYTMTQKDLPPADRGFLNTTCAGGPCIGGIIKKLGSQFPNSTVQISMQTTSAPSLHTTPKDITGRFNGTVSFYIRKPDGNITLGFSTKTVANVSLAGRIALNDSNRITAKVDNINFHMSVTQTHIGPVSDSYLNTVFGLAVKLFVIPKMNEMGQKGFELPSIKQVAFANPGLYQQQGSLCFGTDAKYQPGDVFDHTLYI